MSEDEQFALIEEASSRLERSNYQRESVWALARGNDVYDSSRDELIDDYAGFGPAAFSTFGEWKVVNPHLDVYLDNMARGTRRCFVAPKTKATQDWRRFARMIYDLSGEAPADLPGYIKLYIGVLKAAGYIRKGRLTSKGRYFAHSITKVVVESLPFPVQNPTCVENYGDYTRHREDLASRWGSARTA
jgi:coproporphyrinogen III oxidase-like Fe-S oxidoreductase